MVDKIPKDITAAPAKADMTVRATTEMTDGVHILLTAIVANSL